MEKVIIIGAGPARLCTANELLKLGNYEVLVLEATDAIGGISKTVNYNGNRMDIGGHRFFSKDDTIVNYWNEIMPIQEWQKNINPKIEDNVILTRNRVSRIYYLKKFFDYPISMKVQTFKNMGFVRTIKAGFSYLKSCIFKRKENSLEDFYINRFGKVLYQMFFEKYTQKLWGRHPSEISASWGAQRVKGLSIGRILKNMIIKDKDVETSLIEQFFYPKYGPGQLWEKLADDIEKKGGKILKNHEVVQLKRDGNRITSVICNVDGKQEQLSADIFISSMPLKDLVLGIDKNVPDNILKIAKGLPYVDFQTVGVLTKKLKLKNEIKGKNKENKESKENKEEKNELVPDCWIYIQEPDVKMLRLQIFNNWSPYMVKNPNDTVWVGVEYTCQENDEYWNMKDDEFCKFAIEELEKIGIIDKEDVIDFHREKVKKAYPAYFDTYSKIDDVIDFVNTIENLYCIGRNGQHRYNNMDHSMLCAIEAVNNIKNNIQDRQNIWNVNTQKTYHEVKENG